MGKNNKMYDPYAKGRWYKIFLESDGSKFTITQSDLEGVSVAGTILKTVEHFHILDAIFDVNTVATGSAQAQTVQLYSAADGIQGINLPKVASFDYATIYIFGYIK